MNEIISRTEAKERGLTHYFTGEPCGRGHVVERFVSDRKCKDCVRERNVDRYAKNPERDLARAKAWQAKSPEKVRENEARYRPKYRAENRDKRRENDVRRRAAKRERLPSWYGEFDQLVMTEAADLATRREAVTGFAWHVDHMIPLQARKACGLHCAANLQVIPAALNVRKLNRLVLTQPGEWIKAA